MTLCKLCQASEVDNRALAMCAACVNTLGIIELPPPTRPALPCLRCGERRFIRVVPREYTVYGGMKANLGQVGPMTLTQSPTVTQRLLGRGNTVETPRVDQGKGVLETYVCMSCSFVEWYCQDAHHIPIGPEHMSDIVDYTIDEG